MSVHQFLLDENVDPALQEALHRNSPGMVVWLVGNPGAPGLGALDPEILLWCEAHNFSLVTNNHTSMPVHLRAHLSASHHVPGIFILNPKMSFAKTVDELALLWGASDIEEYSDKINFLSLE